MRLRPYKSCDAASIVSWCEDELTYLRWSSGMFGAYPVSAETFDDTYQNQNGFCKEEDNFYPMAALDDEGNIVGHLIMRYLDGNNKLLRFGWVIVDGNQRGKGYGREMLSLALKYAFEILKVDKVTLGVFDDNQRAYNCYKSVGFKDVEIDFDNSVVLGDYHCKRLELEITGEEWQKREDIS